MPPGPSEPSRRAVSAALAAVSLALGSQARAVASPGGGTGPIAMLLYPGMTALDLAGPQALLADAAREPIQLVAERIGPVESDTGLVVMATHDFETCSRDPRVLFVPGGDGTPAQMRDVSTLAFLCDRAARSGWVASVCTGSLILGAAGLLEGYRATSHWCVRETVLPLLGARPVEARVVFDRNRVTAAGVSAGLDLGLALAARLRGEDHARTAQLVAEYAPQPPFDAGTPGDAGAAITRAANAILAPLVTGARAAALERLGRVPP